jgi:hypothetical protein
MLYCAVLSKLRPLQYDILQSHQVLEENDHSMPLCHGRQGLEKNEGLE